MEPLRPRYADNFLERYCWEIEQANRRVQILTKRGERAFRRAA
jgi:hypothetical protein